MHVAQRSAAPRQSTSRGWLVVLMAEWRHFADDEPGRRFRAQHERQHRRPLAVRIAAPLIGLLCLATGVILAVLPGPGFIFFGLAGATAATQSLAAARALDRGELRARRLRNRVAAAWTQRHHRRAKARRLRQDARRA